jgi:transposase
VRSGANSLRASLPEILRSRGDEISTRMHTLIVDLHEDWLRLDARIDAITDEIEQISKREKSCLKLMTGPGIGPLISTAMVAAIGTGEAFERGRDFGAWIGLIPRQYSTCGKPMLGRISKRGSKYLRTLFIQAANVILMRPKNWEKFSLGAWLTGAASRLHRNKLAAALANKLARIAWSVLRYNKRFDEALAV